MRLNWKVLRLHVLPFNSQDLISNSPYRLSYNSYDVNLENWYWIN